MVKVSGPYTPRSVRFLELWETAGWTVKVYDISARHDVPSPGLIQAAKTIAVGRLPPSAVTDEHYGAAILIVHQGADGD